MRITKVEPTDLFTGTAQQPLQIVRVTLAGDGPGAASGTGAPDAAGTRGAAGGRGSAGVGASAPVSVRIEGPSVSTPRPALVASPDPGQEHTVEVGVELAAPVTEGSRRQVTVIAGPAIERAAGHATGGRVEGQSTRGPRPR